MARNRYPQNSEKLRQRWREASHRYQEQKRLERLLPYAMIDILEPIEPLTPEEKELEKIRQDSYRFFGGEAPPLPPRGASQILKGYKRKEEPGTLDSFFR